MDCRRLREVLDLYVDQELAPEAMSAAETHLAECDSCQRAAEQLLRLRRELKAVVGRYQPPPRLERSIRHPGLFAVRFRVAASVAIFMLLALAGVAYSPGSRDLLATQLERVAFRLDMPRAVVLEGTLLCRDCELHARYGAHPMCSVKGHHGALQTADGKIWNLMETRSSQELIHNHDLVGKKMRVWARTYRRAGTLEVEGYELRS